MNAAQLQDVMHRIHTLKQQGLSKEEIYKQLIKAGLPSDAAQQSINDWFKDRNEKKRNAAFVYCGTGVFLLTTGFLFTVLLFNNSGNYNFALYGLTLVGLLLVFKGMIDLMS